jgi:hypothetical protein
MGSGTNGSTGLSSFISTFFELAMAGLVNIIVYINNLLVHSKISEDHLNQLYKLLSRLRNVGLKAKLPKCEFGDTNVQYLGFRLTPEGILPRGNKLKAVKNTEVPKNVK